MKTKIHNKRLLGDDRVIKRFEEIINHHLPWFRKLYDVSGVKSMDVYLSKSSEQYKAAFYLKQKHQQVFVDGMDENPIRLAEKLLRKLKSKCVKNAIASRWTQRSNSIKEHLPKLNSLQEEGDSEQFHFLIQRLLPTIRGFVLRYLTQLKVKVNEAFNLSDLVDEIYLTLYSRFNERPIDTLDFSAWTYQVARETLEKILKQYETQPGNVAIEQLATEELRSLEEKFSIDAEGELTMYEDFDEQAFMRSTYANEILHEDALIELPLEVEADPLIKEVLDATNTTNRMVFQLFWLHEMTEKEIAKALDMQPELVSQTIENILDQVITKLKSHVV